MISFFFHQFYGRIIVIVHYSSKIDARIHYVLLNVNSIDL